MLIMRRRQGETILIGDNVEIRIVSIGRSKVKIGINAPKEIAVVAKEIRIVTEENRRAARAVSSGALSAAVESALCARSTNPLNRAQARTI